MKLSLPVLLLSLLSLNLNAQPVLKSTVALASGTGSCQIASSDEQVLQLDVNVNYIYALTNKNRLMRMERPNVAHPCAGDITHADLGASIAVNASGGIFFVSASDPTMVKFSETADFTTIHNLTMDLGTVSIQAVDRLFLKGGKLFAIARQASTNLPILLKAQVSDPWAAAEFTVWRNVTDELAPYYAIEGITASDTLLFISTISGTDLTNRVMQTSITDDNPDAAFADLVDLRTLQIEPCVYSSVYLRSWNEIVYIYNHNNPYYPQQVMIADEIANYPRLWYKTLDYTVPVHNLYALAGDSANVSCSAYKPASPDPSHPEYGWGDLGSLGVKPTSMVQYGDQDLYLLVTPISASEQPVFIYEFKFWTPSGIDDNATNSSVLVKDFAVDNGNLSLTFNSAGKYSVSIYDVAGRTIVPLRTVYGDTYTADMSGSAKGIHAIRILDNDKKSVQTLKFAR